MKKTIQFLLIFLGAILLFYPLFLSKTFGEVSFAQFVFHLTTPLKQADFKLIYKGILYVCIIPLISSIVFFHFCRQLKDYQRWILGLFLIIIGISHSFYVLKVPDYYRDIHNPTDLYAKHYINPNQLHLSFKEKKNIILIYWESIENSYQDTALFSRNALPHLSKRQQENTSFKGFQQLPGTGWTIAGITSSLCGVPLKIPVKGIRMDMFSDFLPNLTCLPSILQDNGYYNALLLGSAAQFSGIDNFARAHGFNIFWGINELKKETSITPQMRGTGWGLNDRTLFNIAKTKIKQIARKNQPFLFVLSTIDTHHPNGYFDETMCQKENNNFTDVVHCSDHLMNQFINWIQQQPFAENTLIVVLGDHLTMGNDVYDIIKTKPDREIFNLFINASQPNQHIQKAFSTFDLAPTILAAAGGNSTENAFGLGRNLYTTKKTVLEILENTFFEHINRFSKEYESFF